MGVPEHEANSGEPALYHPVTALQGSSQSDGETAGAPELTTNSANTRDAGTSGRESQLLFISAPPRTNMAVQGGVGGTIPISVDVSCQTERVDNVWGKESHAKDYLE